MRKPRFILKDRSVIYHCTSHLVCGLDPLTVFHKERFRQMLRRHARFSGIEVVTHNEMDTHVHLEVRVPHGPPPSDGEVLRRAQALYGKKHPLVVQVREALQKTGHIPADILATLLPRMGDLSVFMKELKQGFTRWFNSLTGRFGTLWAERFGSVLIEDAPEVAAAIAAYVDLNAVRADVVDDPKDYRFCGYAEAVAGNQQAQEGLLSVLPADTWEEGSEVYREKLFIQAGKAGQAEKAVLSREEILAVVRAGGTISVWQALRLRIRYFTDGCVLGSAAFVNEVFHRYRDRFGPRRKTGARRLRGLPFPNLYCLRDLRVNVLS